jgi:UDP-N-acetylmuramoyl-L-alanyl-D-glutamate--2,6-diaminopimelate ligase
MGSVAGRLEYIKGSDDITVFIDYAHTPDALENVLKTLYDSSNGRDIITVFGCGGNRDKSKRPKMGQIAVKYSNKIVITSDNPRFENPDTIIKEIMEGLSATDKMRALNITDRKEAIRTAITIAPKEAVILIAGKGHETYQDINGEKKHFDDMEIVKEFLNNK